MLINGITTVLLWPVQFLFGLYYRLVFRWHNDN